MEQVTCTLYVALKILQNFVKFSSFYCIITTGADGRAQGRQLVRRNTKDDIGGVLVTDCYAVDLSYRVQMFTSLKCT